MSRMQPLSVIRACDLEERAPETRWLVRSLWPDSAVGILGGQPKSYKTFLALDLVISVCSGTPCVGHFPTERQGPGLVYLAEDSLVAVRQRLEGLCRPRAISLSALDLFVITEPTLRLDSTEGQARLRAVIEDRRPRLLLLDPLVRIHSRDENSAQEMAGLLGYLRELQRAYDVSILLVHHASKRGASRHGQALRGSSDLHAWIDVGIFLSWRNDQLHATVEHRTAASPDPFELALVTSEQDELAHLEIPTSTPTSSPNDLPISKRVLAALEGETSPLRRAEIRRRLRVNNSKLGRALEELEHLYLITRGPEGWSLPNSPSAARDQPTTAPPTSAPCAGRQQLLPFPE